MRTHIPKDTVPVLRRLRLENLELEDSLGCIRRFYHHPSTHPASQPTNQHPCKTNKQIFLLNIDFFFWYKLNPTALETG